MVTTSWPSLQVNAPAGWFFVSSQIAHDDLADLLLNGVDDEGRRDRLRADASRVLAMDRPAHSRAVAAVHPDVKMRDRVIAAGTLSLGPVVDFDVLSQRSESAPIDQGVLARQIDVWGRRSAAVWVRHELRASSGGVLHEQCVVVRNVDGLSAKLVLSTSDLESFTDIAATCVRVVRSLSAQEAKT